MSKKNLYSPVVYEVEGPLFFGSIKQFMDLFDYDGDPADVELHCFQVLQCVLVCCSVFKCVQVCSSVLQCIVMCRSVLDCFQVLQCVLVCCILF